ncbi:autotransporter domain-containing protein [uncultured Erythrobacter sp.]|uniref:autotransporter outer membrane beta-barrel domain-containing protein n=1 Tax=uncultured Erythrobacter sp. TaxID=263913 RepID=UPI00262F39BA|nr:autotransporter domain-containing protein [uncultured Erythrobacter sp.]
MTISASTKFRAIGSASVLALTVGLSGAAFAQSAPPPVGSPPTPTAPSVPANAEECAITAGVVVCAPGTDADGFFDVSGNPLGLDVQDGAVVQDSIIITGAVDGTVAGAIVTTGQFGSGLLIGENSNVTVDGFIQTSGSLALGIETEDNTAVTVNGIVYTTGQNADAIGLSTGSSVTNNGLIQTDGAGSSAILAFGDTATVTNSVTGSIITSNGGSHGVEGVNAVTVDNAGLIQTFGDQASAVTAGAGSSVTNSGNIVTLGDNLTAIALGDNSSVNNSSLIATTGRTAVGVSVGASSTVTNSDTISTEGNDFSDAVVLGTGSTLNNSGAVATDGEQSFAVFGAGDNVTVNNNAGGSLIANGEGSFAISLLNGGTVNNDGSVSTSSDFSFAVDALDDATVVNNGSISTAGASSVGVNMGDNSSLSGTGSITTVGDDSIAVIAQDNSVIDFGAGSAVTTSGVNAGGVVVLGNGSVTNAGDIATSGDGAQGVTVTGDATVNNSGSVSADLARGFDIGGAADFTNSGSVTSGNSDGVRFAGSATASNSGSISGVTGIAGEGDAQTVVNSGSITGTGGTAVALGDGADSFEQAAGGSTSGDVDLGLGDDTFVLSGTSSSIAGSIFGGDGTDTALLGGTLDSDNLSGFENTSINGARISGDRTLQGDVVVDGQVTLGLGVDTLTSTGAMTLENTGEVVIETPLDAALLGQTVLVLQEGTTFTDNGATITILDDDLLIDYTPVFGSLSVQVSAADPLVTSADPNVVTFGSALSGAVTAGTISTANFDLLNDLPDAAALEGAALDALPSLSEGAGREIFESSNAASQALTRHLSGEGTGVWGEITVRGAEQDAVSPSAGGYESEQKIFTIGGDFAVGETARIGLLASYADIENDDLSGGIERGETEIESMKFGVYGGVTFMERGFLNGEVAYLTGEVETGRNGVLGPINSAFDFDGWAYSATAGYDLLGGDQTSVTPFVGINGAKISFDNATETGGFGFGVVRDDAEFTELRGGIELAGQFGMVRAFVSGTGIHDLGDDARNFNLTSAELGNFTVALPTREDNRFELAAGATVDVSPNFSIGLGYLGDFADGYDGHAGRATMRLAF